MLDLYYFKTLNNLAYFKGDRTMKPFSISEIYVNKNNLKLIDINPLPQKFTEDIFSFKENIEFINRLNKFVIDNNIEYVFINPNGEALANKELLNIIKLLK